MRRGPLELLGRSRAMPRRGRLDDELRGEIDLSLRRERLFAQLATLLGGVTLLLATVGLYGLLAYSVTRRMPELGLRMGSARAAELSGGW